MTDIFENWRRALRGEKQPIYESEPWVGYFAVQDRSPGVTPALAPFRLVSAPLG